MATYINGVQVLATPTVTGTISSTGGIRLLPATGQIVTVGDAGATSHTLAANDDLLVTGKLEVDGAVYFDGALAAQGITCTAIAPSTSMGGAATTTTTSRINHYLGGNAYGILRAIDTNITVAAGSGSAGVASNAVFDAESCLILGVITKVTQAPGGGAITFDLGLTGSGNVDEFIDGRPVTLNSKSDSLQHNDGTVHPIKKAAATTTLTLTTDANVTGASLIVRVWVCFLQISSALA